MLSGFWFAPRRLHGATPQQSGRATFTAASIALATFIAVLPACTPASTGSGVAPAAAGASKFEVEAKEFSFNPKELKMGGPGELTITLENKGAIEHDFLIDGVEGKVFTKTKEKATGTFKIAKAGAYTFFCSIAGHRDAGMVGTLNVGNVSSAANTGTTQPANAPAAAAVKPVMTDAKPLPAPQMAPPITRKEPAYVKVEIETKEINAVLADGLTYKFWTFGGTVPGPMVRVRQGDTVEIILKNAPDSEVTHSIDFHSVTGPGGGAKATQVPPGGSLGFKWLALNPGVYVYHCATPMVAHHIASGMYGLIVVEPEAGLAPVDKEFYVMQGDFYIKGERGQSGHHEFGLNKMLDERPDYVVFNGRVGALTGAGAMKAKVGETVRIFFGVGGPNLTSSFHVIGEIFDRVYPEGASEPMTNVQTTLVPTGGSAIVEFKVEVPGDYILVDHSLGRLEKGGAGILTVEGPDNPAVFQPFKP